MIGLGINNGIGIGSSSAASPIYNSAALTSFNTAITNRASSPVKIMVFGDSWTEGANGTAYGTRYVDKIATGLRTKYATAGATGPGGANYIPALFTVDGAAAAGWNPYSAVLSGGGVLGSAGLGGRSATLQTTLGEGYTYTYTCTSFDVWWFGNFGDSDVMGVQVDGGAVTTIDTSTLGFRTRKQASGALSDASHAIKITLNSAIAGDPYVLFQGLTLFRGDETKGIHVFEAGRAGALVATAASTPDGTADGPQAQVATILPHLSILHMIVNDYNAQTALAAYKTSVQTWLTGLRGLAGATHPVLLVTTNYPTNEGAKAIPYTSYVAKLREVCDADQYTGLIDLSASIVNAGADTGHAFWDTDLLHPNVAGHATLSSLIVSAL